VLDALTYAGNADNIADVADRGSQYNESLPE